MKARDTKIEIPCTNRCSRCKDISKFNQANIDNYKNLLIVEWICDCGFIEETETKIKYI
ncbi:hypothetical protein P5F71_07880 [Clostridium perfringens]|nr:hypothetical protein [Clostridium perfringens]